VETFRTAIQVVHKVSRVWLLQLLGLLLVSITIASPNTIKYTGTFSSLEYHKEGGDLLGVELRIVWTRAGYQGVLQISEGEPDELIIVHPVFEDNKVSFKFDKPGAYRGVFKGTINQKGIIGVLKFDTGGISKIELERKRSYWD